MTLESRLCRKLGWLLVVTAWGFAMAGNGWALLMTILLVAACWGASAVYDAEAARLDRERGR